MTLQSKIVVGPQPEPETGAQLLESINAPAGTPIGLMLFETTLNGKKVYCCASGGELRDDSPHLTLTGTAALEALMNIPTDGPSLLVFQELKMGPTPLPEKIRAAVELVPSGAKVCFVGDMQGELDGHMLKALNVDGPVYIDC